MAFIRTVLGDIPPEQLGFTSMHEHTTSSAWKMGIIMLKTTPDMIRGANGYQNGADINEESERRKQAGISEVPQINFREIIENLSLPRSNPARKLSSINYYSNELKAFREFGGQAICDCSPFPYGGSRLRDVQDISREAGVHIVAGAGYYTNPSIPKRLLNRGRQALEDNVMNVLTQGERGCDAKPGFLKCAVSTLSDGKVITSEWTAVLACASVAKKMGMALHIHTAFPVRKVHIMELADVLEHEIGILPNKVIFCHMDSYNIGVSNPTAQINADGYDISLPAALAQRGFNIGLDTWSISSKDSKVVDYALNARKKLLLELVERGFASRITLGHDMMSKASGLQNGGSGYTLWPDTLRKLVDQQFLSKKHFYEITVSNPAKILAI